MTQEERRVFLIRYLLHEDIRYRKMAIPEDPYEQKQLLRALMNVRPPRPVSQAFLDIQDAYLTQENTKAGIVDADGLLPCASDDRLVLWQGDITTLKIGAIVNAANSGMTGCYRPLHNCIDNCIHTKAGIQLRLKCADLIAAQGHEEPTGQAKLTPAYNLPCQSVIHTVGPIVDGDLSQRHCDLLSSCYRSCLKKAEENGLGSIAFCCISTGVFMFPKEKAAAIAVGTVKDYLDEHSGMKRVVFNVFSDEDRIIYERLL